MSEISKIKVITLTPFTSSEYHLWIASALATFKVYKVDKLILGTEKEPKSDNKSEEPDESHLKHQESWDKRITLTIEVLLTCPNKVDKMKVFRMTNTAKI